MTNNTLDRIKQIKETIDQRPNSSMFPLIYIDGLITNMRYLDGKTDIDPDYNKHLRKFIESYMFLAKLVYGQDYKKAMQKHVYDLDLSINVFEKPNLIEQAKKLFPDTKDIFDKISEVEKSIKDSEKQLAVEPEETQSNLGNIEDFEALDQDIKDALRDKKFLKGRRRVIGFREKDGKNYVVVSVTGEGLYDQFNKSITQKEFTLNKIDEKLAERLNNLGGADNFLATLRGAKKDVKVSLENKNKAKSAQKDISSSKMDLTKLYRELNGAITQSILKDPKSLLLSFAPGTRDHNPKLAAFINQAFDSDQIRPDLVKGFQNDKKLWDYVKDNEYYNMVKLVVDNKGDYDAKTAETYGSKELNELLQARSKIVKHLNSNKSEHPKPVEFKYNGNEYRVAYQAIPVEKGLHKNFNKELDQDMHDETSSIRLSTLIDALGQGQSDKRGTPLNDLYEDFRSNIGSDFDRWMTGSKLMTKPQDVLYSFREFLNKKNVDFDIHHIQPRRLSAVLDSTDPEKAWKESKRLLNNKDNLAMTIKWKAWQQDNHQFLGHFAEMVNSSGRLQYLGNQNGEVTRKGRVNDLDYVYHEVMQIKGPDGKYVDAIPQGTLAMTSSGIGTANKDHKNNKEKATHLQKISMENY